MDRVSPECRSAMMSRVRGKDTTPELAVRRLVHSLGFRFRLHRSDLPGKPDLTFPGRSAVIFVHGCFWHRHTDCAKATVPQTRRDFWLQKLERNVLRDEQAIDALHRAGWKTLVVWECELKEMASVSAKIESFLSRDPAASRCGDRAMTKA